MLWLHGIQTDGKDTLFFDSAANHFFNLMLFAGVQVFLFKKHLKLDARQIDIIQFQNQKMA
jgi:hypothetical protein